MMEKEKFGNNVGSIANFPDKYQNLKTLLSFAAAYAGKTHPYCAQMAQRQFRSCVYLFLSLMVKTEFKLQFHLDTTNS